MPLVFLSRLTIVFTSFRISDSEGILMPSILSSFMSEAALVLLLLRFKVPFMVPDPFAFISIYSTISKQELRLKQATKSSNPISNFFIEFESKRKYKHLYNAEITVFSEFLNLTIKM